LGFSCYFTAVVVFESHTVPVVPALVPVTPTAMNLPFKAAVRVNVVVVALEILVQVAGTD
jgi:hypothetical protein